MKIGVDFDGVICCFTSLLSRAEGIAYFLLKIPIFGWFINFFRFPNRGVIAAIRYLIKNGHEIVIITANPPEQEWLIKRWLQRYGLEVPIILKKEAKTRTAQWKLKVVQEMGIDILIDDNPHVLNYVQRFGIKGFLPEQIKGLLG